MLQQPMHQYDSPPSYDLATQDGDVKSNQGFDAKQQPKEHQAVPAMQSSQPYTTAGPSFTPHSPSGPAPTVYHYVNPLTQDHVASLLPPDHPEMICLQSGKHVPQTKFGILGILAAVFWFPLGVGLCLLDRRVKCARCGHRIADGFCD